METIKTYKAVLLGVFGLAVVVGGAYWFMKDNPAPKAAVVSSSSQTLEGELVRTIGEAESSVVYNLDIPEGATTTLGMNNALVKVSTEKGLLAAMYFSFEGSRGYSARDYIMENIMPRVHGVTVVGTTTIGSYTWTVAQSAGSEWYVGQVGDGRWLLVVENRKGMHDEVMKMLDTLTTK